MSRDPHRSGFVALSGRPNAGKSTLLNALLGQKISIVSSKPQTTRNRILGIQNEPGAQVIWVDTPGLTSGDRELGKRMLRGAQGAMAEADLVVWLSDAARGLRDLDDGRRAFARAGKPIVLALSKVDLVSPKQKLLPLIEAWTGVEGVEVVVPVSGLRADGLDRLLAEVLGRLPEGPPLYPEEMLTDRPERFIAGELIREQVLRLARQEVPHAVAVEVTSWREADGRSFVEATIHVEREGQKGILVGKGGSMIKQIGETARAEMATLLGNPVDLRLRVGVSPGWRGNARALDAFGLDE